MPEPLIVIAAPDAGVSVTVSPLAKFVPVTVIVWLVLLAGSDAGEMALMVAATTFDGVGAGAAGLEFWAPHATAQIAIPAGDRRREHRVM